MSWRDEQAKALEDFTSLDGLAKAIREGVKIDRNAWPWWRNHLAEKKKKPVTNS